MPPGGWQGVNIPRSLGEGSSACSAGAARAGGETEWGEGRGDGAQGLATREDLDVPEGQGPEGLTGGDC